MSLLISISLILFGISASILEFAIISLEDVERLRSSIASKIEKFRKSAGYFSLSFAILKFLPVIFGFLILGAWINGRKNIFLLLILFVPILLYIVRLTYHLVEREPEFFIKFFEPILVLSFLLFKILSFIPEIYVAKFAPKSVNFVRHEFEFLMRNVKQDETPDENQLLKNVLEFNDKTVREIMIPRTKVVALDVNAPREKVVKVVLNEGYSRLPVYKDTIDNIIGIVYAKDLINYIEEPNLFVLYDLVRPAYFVPETKKISELLRELQKNKIHMAIVVDEFGGFEGIVTLEDILEEIVGEIHDEYDKVEKNYEILKDGSIVVDASMQVSDFNKKFNVDIPEGTDYESLGGFVSKLAGRIPEEGEKIKFGDFYFEVLKKTNRKIIELKITGSKK